jgi:hypothetical protein
LVKQGIKTPDQLQKAQAVTLDSLIDPIDVNVIIKTKDSISQVIERLTVFDNKLLVKNLFNED